MALYDLAAKYWREASLSGILFAVIFMNFAGVWTWGSAYREVVADRDTWKTMALKALHAAEQGGLPPGVVGEDPPPPATISLREVQERLAALPTH